MSNKEIHGVVKANFDSIKNVSGEEIIGAKTIHAPAEEIKGTTKIYVDVPIVPRWVSDILTDCQTNDYSQFKLLFNFRCHDLGVTKKLKEFCDNNGSKKIDLAIALGVWVVEDEGE